jgi:hypothetical protein
MQYHKFHGNLPGYDNRKIRSGENIDPDKAAFSMAPHDDEAYERVNMDDAEVGYGANSSLGGNASGTGNDRYNSNANPYSADDYDNPDRYGTGSNVGGAPGRNQTMFDDETEYSSGGAPPPRYGGSQVSSNYDSPAQFPSGAYDRIER